VKLILGFDPGGNGRFGWAIAEAAKSLPLTVRETGQCSNSEEALRGLEERQDREDEIVAAGIDAPLFWTARGSRSVDKILRKALVRLGCPNSSGTVQNPNSLR
jgi:predicted nuclease with RNAse H fold